MKIALKAAEYTFAPGSNAITFNVTGFDIRSLFYVANIATRTDIYVVADQALGGVSVNGSVVTFPVAMTGMTAGDPLLILYDDRLGAQPVSAASLPLPLGASTSAKQPVLGTAGFPSGDVLTVQGAPGATPQPVSGTVATTQSGAWSVSLSGTAAVTQSGTWTVNLNGGNTTAVKVDGSAVTQPVSGTIAVSNAFALDATLTARLGTLGQKPAAGSTPVVIASDQSAVPVSGTVTANFGTLNGAATAANQTAVTGSATGGTAAASSQLSGGVYNSTAPTLGNGQQAALQFDVNGQLKVVAAGGGTSSGSIGAAGTNGTNAQSIQGITNGVPAPTLAVATSAANAVLEGRVASAASTNATSLKTSAGNLVGIEVYNIATSVRYLKVYNKASAPTVGTDTPTWTIPLPAGGGFSWEPPIPRTFATGLAYAITGGVADNDTTAVAVNDVVGVIRYL